MPYCRSESPDSRRLENGFRTLSRSREGDTLKYDLPVIEATFLRRYKRFFADVELDDGTVLTVHCPNSGSMKTCSEPGWRCRITDSGNPKRKLRHTLEQVRGRSWIGVNPGRANTLAEEALRGGLVPELGSFDTLRREVAVGKGTRLDILLESGAGRTWVEVKSVSMRTGRDYLFPDAVTTRGQKHLVELDRLRAAGDNAAMIYVIQRRDGDAFRPADGIDPEYGRILREVAAAGVTVAAVNCRFSKTGITVDGRVDLALD